MRAAPVVSVILPVYNAQKYVEQAVNSILGQSFSNLELILIDDGSTDGTTEIVKRLASQDERLVLIARENRGLVASLNEGLQIAKGEYIARMDADDIALPYRLAHQLAFLRSNQYDLCGTAVQCIGQKKRVWRYPTKPEEVAAHLLFDPPYAHPSVMCKASVYKALCYREEFVAAEDYDLWQRAWQTGAVGANIDNILLHYRVHDLQISNVHKVQQQFAADIIRRRHWIALAGARYAVEIDTFLEMLRCGAGDIESVKPMLMHVIRQFHGAGQVNLLENIFRVACKVAASSKNPWRIWRQLLAEHDMSRNRSQELILLIVWILRIGPDSSVFQQIRSWYLNWKQRN